MNPIKGREYLKICDHIILILKALFIYVECFDGSVLDDFFIWILRNKISIYKHLIVDFMKRIANYKWCIHNIK